MSNREHVLKSIRFAVAGLALSLPALGFAQAPNLAASTYIDLEVGTGKVGLNCPANAACSRVDSNLTVRAGHRFDSSWAFEVIYAHTEADWGLLGRNYSAEYTGFGLGAAYTLPLSDSVGAVLRLGGASNELKLQPAVGLTGTNPGTTTTHAVKPYLGLGLSWQFARHWSTSLNADWTRADLRDTPSSARQGVTVRTLGVGIAFNF
jgi:outer membrane protein assembly factor BamA